MSEWSRARLSEGVGTRMRTYTRQTDDRGRPQAGEGLLRAWRLELLQAGPSRLEWGSGRARWLLRTTFIPSEWGKIPPVRGP